MNTIGADILSMVYLL